FIIWDRLFGTFESELADSAPLQFGLTHPLTTFNAWNVLTDHYRHMVKMAREYPKWSEKVKVFLFGPGWEPGKGRLGDLNDIPESIDPEKEPEYDVAVPKWFLAYMRVATMIHLAVFYFPLIA